MALLIIAFADQRSVLITCAIVLNAFMLPVAELAIPFLSEWKPPKRWYLWIVNHGAIGASVSCGALLALSKPGVTYVESQAQSTVSGFLGLAALLSVLLTWGVVVRYRLPRLSVAIVLDGAIITIGAALLLMTVTSRGETVDGSAVGDVVFTLVIPVVAIALLSAIVRLVSARHNRLPSLWFLGAAFLCGLSTQLIQGVSSNAEFVERATCVALGLMTLLNALSVLHPSHKKLMEPIATEGPRESPNRIRIAALAAAALIVPFSAMYRELHAHHGVDLSWAIGSVGLLLLVGWRVMLAISAQAQAERAMLKTIREQAVVAQLSQSAAQRPDKRELMTEASALVTTALGCEAAVFTERDLAGNWSLGAAMQQTPMEDLLGRVLDHGFASCEYTVETKRYKAVGVVVGETKDVLGAFVITGQGKWNHDKDTLNFLQSIAYVIGIAIRQERMEQELEQSRKLESVGRLAAGVAHEINTPIQFIGDNARFLKEAISALAAVAAEPTDSEDDILFYREEGPLAVSQVLDGVERVAGIVRAMRSFSHVNGGDVAAADINEAIQNALIVAGSELRDVVEVSTDLQSLPLVVCRIAEVNQVLLNLIVNAADAMHAAYETSNQIGRLEIATQSEGDTVVITIGDNGGGIPDAIKDKIFDQFFTTKVVGKGTGQGLAIARTIMQSHGGEISFTSDSSGTVFELRLPCR